MFKRLLRKPIRVVLLIVSVAVLLAAGVEIYHYYERRHVTIVFLDDIAASRPPDGILNVPLTQQNKALDTDAAFDDFSAAFAQDSDCRGLTLVRYTTAHERAWQFPYAYWYLDLDPVIRDDSESNGPGVSEHYSQLNWQLRMNAGT